MRLALAFILLGIFFIFLGMFSFILEAAKTEKVKADYAGFIFIGPFPIGVASSRQMAYFALFFGLFFFFLILVFFRP